MLIEIEHILRIEHVGQTPELGLEQRVIGGLNRVPKNEINSILALIHGLLNQWITRKGTHNI